MILLKLERGKSDNVQQGVLRAKSGAFKVRYFPRSITDETSNKRKRPSHWILDTERDDATSSNSWNVLNILVLGGRSLSYQCQGRLLRTTIKTNREKAT